MLTVRKASSMLKNRGYRHSPNGKAHFYYKGLNTIIVQQGSEFLDYGKETDKNFIVVYFKKLPDNLNKADVDAFMAKQIRIGATAKDFGVKDDETIKAYLDIYSQGLNAGARLYEVFDKLEDFERWLNERERLCEHLEDQFVEYALDKAESKTKRRLARKETRWNHILKKRRMERKNFR